MVDIKISEDYFGFDNFNEKTKFNRFEGFEFGN